MRKEVHKVNGLFITFEGPDGSGKTSVIQQIVPRLERALGQSVVATREPGGSRIAETIRQVILNPEHTEMDARTEALLYAASRRQHITETILPALEGGEIVLCDRFVDSSLVYQGIGRGIGVEEVAEMNRFATEGLKPDVTLYLDVESEVGLERIKQNQGNRQYDRLDQETLAFHRQVREGYLTLLEKYPERITRIDANQSLADVVEDTWRQLEQFIAQHYASKEG